MEGRPTRQCRTKKSDPNKNAATNGSKSANDPEAPVSPTPTIEMQRLLSDVPADQILTRDAFSKKILEHVKEYFHPGDVTENESTRELTVLHNSGSTQVSIERLYDEYLTAKYNFWVVFNNVFPKDVVAQRKEDVTLTTRDGDVTFQSFDYKAFSDPFDKVKIIYKETPESVGLEISTVCLLDLRLSRDRKDTGTNLKAVGPTVQGSSKFADALRKLALSVRNNYSDNKWIPKARKQIVMEQLEFPRRLWAAWKPVAPGIQQQAVPALALAPAFPATPTTPTYFADGDESESESATNSAPSTPTKKDDELELAAPRAVNGKRAALEDMEVENMPPIKRMCIRPDGNMDFQSEFDQLDANMSIWMSIQLEPRLELSLSSEIGFGGESSTANYPITITDHRNSSMTADEMVDSFLTPNGEREL